MFQSPMQLACVFLTLLTQCVYSQEITATATQNGIVSAQGGPSASRTAQSISYSIMGGDMLGPTTIQPPPDAVLTATPNSASATMGEGLGSSENLSSGKEQGLSTAAIAGITAAVILSVVAIVVAVIFSYRRRRAVVARAKRKSIMDKEFASSKQHLQRFHSEMTTVNTPNNATVGNIGYFDIAKPLPAVVATQQPPTPKFKDDDCLSRSSTIIADAAEIAQINRKASTHQARGKMSREAQRERNQALQILITSEDNRTSAWPSSPLSSNPNTPVNAEEDPNGSCTDGNGDSFAKRASRI